MRMPVHLEIDGTVIDYIDFEPYGTIRVCGWSLRDEPLHCEIETREGVVRPTATYRYARDDVCAALGIKEPFAGVSVEFRVQCADVRSVVLGNQNLKVAEDVAALLKSENQGYVELLDGDRVLHRDDIYREGPPSDAVHPQILQFAFLLQPHILDFGCGNGALIRAYRAADMEASGIEIARPPIRNSLRSDVAPFIKLYDGTLPLPFADGQFESVIATEVIEHVPDYRTALAEIARVCRSTFAVTVPDMTCIPIGRGRGYVPWHLLEPTHVNFFNHRSLAKALAPHFHSIRFFQIARSELEGKFMPGSLAAIATK